MDASRFFFFVTPGNANMDGLIRTSRRETWHGSEKRHHHHRHHRSKLDKRLLTSISKKEKMKIYLIVLVKHFVIGIIDIFFQNWNPRKK